MTITDYLKETVTHEEFNEEYIKYHEGKSKNDDFFKKLASLVGMTLTKFNADPHYIEDAYSDLVIQVLEGKLKPNNTEADMALYFIGAIDQLGKKQRGAVKHYFDFNNSIDTSVHSFNTSAEDTVFFDEFIELFQNFILKKSRITDKDELDYLRGFNDGSDFTKERKFFLDQYKKFIYNYLLHKTARARN